MKGPALLRGLLAGLTMVVLLAIGMGLASVLTLHSLSQEQELELEQESTEREAVQHLIALNERLARYTWDWLLTQEPRAQMGLEVTREQWEAQLARLEDMLTQEEEQAILSRIRARQQAIQEVVDRLIAQGVDPDDLELLPRREISALREGLEQDLALLMEFEQAVLRDVIHQHEQRRLRAITRLGVTMIAAVLVSSLLGLLLARSRRQLEAGRQRLADTLALQDALYASAPVGLGFFDKELRCFQLNAALAGISGLSMTACNGSTVEEMFPRLAPRLTEELRRVLHTGQSLKNVALSAEEPSPAGAVRHWLCDFYPVYGAEDLLGVGVIFNDVTARVRAEEAVRRSEALFRATFNHAAVGLTQVGLTGRWLLLNDRFCEIVGYHREELLGLTLADITHPDDLGVDLAYIRQLLEREISTYSLEKRYIRKDLSVVWVNITVTLVRDEAGEPQYFLTAVEDITRRKALEEERELLLAETREALQLREEFLSVASHELRTPLTPLRLRLQMLLREPRTNVDPSFARRMEEHVRTSLHQVQRMTRLIDEVLDASHSSSGLLVLSLEQVDLAELMREVARRFELVAVRAGCELKVEAESPVVGQWDRRRLEQVVSSLLSNALKFGAGRPVHLRAELVGDMARLTVRDEGIGIAPEDLPRIFGRFSRGVSDRHYGGLGLGLFLTRYVVESLGGAVRAESIPGQGATFVIELPLGNGHGNGKEEVGEEGGARHGRWLRRV